MKKNLLSILALGLGFGAMAQINYTDINDVTLSPATTPETLGIDLDNDGTADFVMFALDTTVQVGTPPQTFPLNTLTMGINFNGTNGAVGSVSNITGAGDILKIDTITSGSAINSGLSYVNSASSSTLIFNGGGLFVYSSLSTDGDFGVAQDKYIGVEFKISGATHYGWIRVNVATDASTMVIKDFAYEETAGTAINAGETGVSSTVNENSLENAVVFYANNQLNIKGIEGNYNVNVVDLLGKSIYNKNVNGYTNINLNVANNGVYLVQIAKGETLITKKVFVQK